MIREVQDWAAYGSFTPKGGSKPTTTLLHKLFNNTHLNFQRLPVRLQISSGDSGNNTFLTEKPRLHSLKTQTNTNILNTTSSITFILH